MSKVGAAWFTSFRPLAIFWSVSGGTLISGALLLQVIGAPHATVPRAEPALAPAGETGQRSSSALAGKPNDLVSTKASTDPVVDHVALASARLGPPPAALFAGPAIVEPVQALLEPAQDLPGQALPRIGPDGRSADHVYATTFSADERHPRIALVIDGLGLDVALSEQAQATLPIAIDFAYSAYAPAAASLAKSGRQHGRECLVSLPMEPAGYPLSDEGTMALLTGADPEANRQNMQTALAHVQGCVGATAASDGMAGERFAEMHESYSEILGEIATRGMLYLDPRPGGGSRGGSSEMNQGSRVRTVDVVADAASDASAPATAETIDANLAALERLAQERGSAIGLAGPPQPVLLERIAVWANGLAARGLVLAPLTAIRKSGPLSPSDTRPSAP